MDSEKGTENSIRIRFPDDSVKEYPRGITPAQIAAELGRRLARDAIAAMFNGQVVDLNRPLTEDGTLRILTFADPEGREVYRHSTSHILAQAVQDLFPGAKLAIGPPIADGFYYDFDVPQPFTPEDLERLEQRMREIIKEDQPFERVVLSREEARRLFQERNEPYKVEILDEIQEDTVTLYRNADKWLDLCRGPHVPSTGRIRAFKLLSSSGAYWRGDERNKMLQRIYGTAYDDPKDLEEHLRRLEEAARRDHRKLGRELELFTFLPEAPASPFFFPKGALVYNLLVEYVRSLYRRYGYQEVITPQILSRDLWEKSGHYENYREYMFFTAVENREFAIKPMNCPAHVLMYATKRRSYRELPIRYADFGRLHRFERSGVTHGLTRVRSFSQDDAHIFCRPDQIQQEVHTVIEMILEAYSLFEFQDLEIGLSTRPEKAMGSEELWREAEAALAQALEAKGVAYEIRPGEGAFYGPKIDFVVHDALGRPWQLGTIQLDFNLPERFGLTYIQEDGSEGRPVMIHRAMLGSIERFMGILVEHCAGAFPFWLAPLQVLVLPIADRHRPYAEEVARRLRRQGLRVEVDARRERVQHKIAEAEVQKVPYMLVVGDREAEEGLVAVRQRGRKDLGPMPWEDFLALIRQEKNPFAEEALEASLEREVRRDQAAFPR